MGFFKSKKQQPKKQPSTDDVAKKEMRVFDKQYREELRESGRQQFQKAMDENAAAFKKEFDDAIANVTNDLKHHMREQMDQSIVHINNELARQLDERLAQYDELTKDAQDQAVQSLNRNAQTLFERYEQLEQTIQQTASRQEAMVNEIFEENKARLSEAHKAQEKTLATLQSSTSSIQQRSTQINQTFQKAIDEQEALLKDAFAKNEERVAATKTAQEEALQTLTASADALKKQHEELSQTIENKVAQQEEMLIGTFRENMARIVEYYVRGTLGEQFDVSAQLPAIIKQLEANKQAIEEDMKL